MGFTNVEPENSSVLTVFRISFKTGKDKIKRSRKPLQSVLIKQAVDFISDFPLPLLIIPPQHRLCHLKSSFDLRLFFLAFPFF